MANKYALLKKKLVKESVMLAVALVVLAGGGFVLQDFAVSALSEQQNKENEVSSSRTKLAELRKEMEGGQSQINLYNKYIAAHNPNLTLNREEMTKWMVDQREKFHLANVAITIPPFNEIKDTLPMKSGVLIKSDVKLEFSALTDNSVFAFISELQRSAPGIAMLQDIKLTQNGALTASTLTDLSNRRITPLVKAEVAFSWIGLKQPEVKPADAASKGIPDMKGNTNAP